MSDRRQPLEQTGISVSLSTIVTFFIAILFRTGREHHPPGVS
jgi:hypothetical protein